MQALGDADLTFTAVPVVRDNESVRERIMVIARNSGLARDGAHNVTRADLIPLADRHEQPRPRLVLPTTRSGLAQKTADELRERLIAEIDGLARLKVRQGRRFYCYTVVVYGTRRSSYGWAGSAKEANCLNLTNCYVAVKKPVLSMLLHNCHC